MLPTHRYKSANSASNSLWLTWPFFTRFAILSSFANASQSSSSSSPLSATPSRPRFVPTSESAAACAFCHFFFRSFFSRR